MKSTKILLLLIFIAAQISCSSDGNDSSTNENGNGGGTTPVEKTHTGYVHIETQGQLNIFAANNYTKIVGGLTISGDITSISGLESLKKVYGNLSIWNTLLTNIDGLKNTNIYPLPFPAPNELLSISIRNNELLQNLDGLQSISNPIDRMDIDNNTVLENIDGLSNLSNISYSLEITGLDNITNLNGLSGISNPITSVIISNNDALTDASGLSNLPKITGVNSRFDFQNNDAITALNGLTNLTRVDGELSILNNALLENINGLSNLEFCGELAIQGHPKLINLNGLNKLKSITNRVYIGYNSVLADFCALNTLVTTDGYFGLSVYGNLYNPTLVDLQNGNCSL
jgi:hypothetical protein